MSTEWLSRPNSPTQVNSRSQGQSSVVMKHAQQSMVANGISMLHASAEGIQLTELAMKAICGLILTSSGLLLLRFSLCHGGGYFNTDSSIFSLLALMCLSCPQIKYPNKNLLGMGFCKKLLRLGTTYKRTAIGPPLHSGFQKDINRFWLLSSKRPRS